MRDWVWRALLSIADVTLSPFTLTCEGCRRLPRARPTTPCQGGRTGRLGAGDSDSARQRHCVSTCVRSRPTTVAAGESPISFGLGCGCESANATGFCFCCGAVESVDVTESRSCSGSCVLSGVCDFCCGFCCGLNVCGHFESRIALRPAAAVSTFASLERHSLRRNRTLGLYLRTIRVCWRRGAHERVVWTRRGPSASLLLLALALLLLLLALAGHLDVPPKLVLGEDWGRSPLLLLLLLLLLVPLLALGVYLPATRIIRITCAYIRARRCRSIYGCWRVRMRGHLVGAAFHRCRRLLHDLAAVSRSPQQPPRQSTQSSKRRT